MHTILCYFASNHLYPTSTCSVKLIQESPVAFGRFNYTFLFILLFVCMKLKKIEFNRNFVQTPILRVINILDKLVAKEEEGFE